MQIIELAFWICLALVFYNYIGYGILLYVLVWAKETKKEKKEVLLSPLEEYPEVTLFIAAYNEEQVVDEKMSNTLALDYPSDKLHILWVTDGSTDATHLKLSAYPQAQVCFSPPRRGKVAAFNHGMQQVNTPYVIFCDANTRLNREAIKEIVRCFLDIKVGCVSGEKRVNIEESKNGKPSHRGSGAKAAQTEGVYWKYESFLKDLDARLYSAVGAAGELFAIRTELFEILPEDTLLDDFVLSMRIAMKGYRIAYCKEAYAMEESSANMKEEAKRKLRISAGGWQSVGRLIPLLNIFKYGCLSFQYFSHRVMRWCISPFLLVGLLPLNVALVMAYPEGFLYPSILVLQLLFYVASLLGYLLSLRNIKQKYLYVAYYFMFMNLNVFRGIVYLFTHKSLGVWQKAKRA